ncbi:MAG: transglycosylase SLT domain-containing protein [Gemmatimonadota bacterium]|nr:transglycosylase SLT domain-containing protein [Gemmatimonadota bacterium]
MLWASPYAFVLASVGCAAVPEQTPPPAPVAMPRIELAQPDLGPPAHVAYLAPPSGEPTVDELLASSVMRNAEFRDAVDRWVDYWQNAARPWFPDFVRRMGGFEQTVDSALAARSMPPSLRYLPLIESGYNPSARSHAAAVGMWQFMPATALERGMAVGPFVDQRRDPFVATAAAVGFLESLRQEFDSWFLALAAYNGGPNRTRRILRQHAPLAQPSDSLFWALRRHWPRETREFVPKLVGAILVAQNPTAYGYPVLASDPPFRFDEVSVPDGTTFDVLAEAAEITEEDVRRLNPELYRGFTPPGVAYTLRVPEGRGDLFEANYAIVPPDRRMTIVEHSVANGETLSHIALRYGVSVSDLRAANPSVRPRFLRVGTRLTVPLMLGR